MREINKVATLTLPLHHNYGGLIQAYALQQFLLHNGYDAELINIDGHSLKPFFKSTLYRIKSLLSSRNNYHDDGISCFPNEHIRMTKKLYSLRDWKRNDIGSFDAYIVGSDQVWRADYANNIECFYFSEINHEDKIMLSYAASLGFEEVRYTEKSKKLCSNLLTKFKAVSLREIEAVESFSSQMKVKANPVLDPTMLLSCNDYNKLIKEDSFYSKDMVFSYILDVNEEKKKIIDYISSTLNISSYIFNSEGGKRSMGDWLSGFKNCDFVVTDSFHGVVFSIIYRKQFIAIGNAERGLSRFTSLLRRFDLIDRLVTDVDSLKELNIKPIDFKKVEELLERELNSSKFFLLNNLK